MDHVKRRIKRFAAGVTALSLGAVASGCAPQAPGDAVGSICAAPAEGGEFCVAANQSPAGAWNKAAAHGSLPIQMWALWPSAVSLDEVVESPEKLDAWFADIDKVVAYLRDTKRNAESYKASLEGNLDSLLRQATERQAAILAEMPVDAIGGFKKALTNKASAEKDPLVAAVAMDKQSMLAVQTVFEQATGGAAPLEGAYADLVTAFSAYRATEAAEVANYASLAAQASSATAEAIPGIEQAILAASLAASGKPNELRVSAMKLSAQIQVTEIASQKAIAQHRDFLATHGAALPNMTSGALRSITAMLGYVQQRVSRSDATATALLGGAAMRAQTLTLLKTKDAGARLKIAQAALLKAGTTFQAGASARVAALSAAPEASKALKLPYLARRYDQITALLQMQPLCDPSSSSWREAGCGALRAQFSAAAAYRETTLPMLIKAGVATMRAKGVDAALLDAVQAKLTAGDVKGAALVYDAAVRATEGI
jgi:hypothetical protein